MSEDTGERAQDTVESTREAIPQELAEPAQTTSEAAAAASEPATSALAGGMLDRPRTYDYGHRKGDERAPKIRDIDVWTVTIGIVLAVIAIAGLVGLHFARGQAEAAHARYDECVKAVDELMDASDYLTEHSRLYVVTGKRDHLDAYVNELQTYHHRDEAVETLNADVNDATAAGRLSEALEESNDLVQLELYAMRMKADAMGDTSVPEMLAEVELKAQDAALDDATKQERAQSLLLGEEYSQVKSLIINDVDNSANELISTLESQIQGTERFVWGLTIVLIVDVLAFVALVAGVAIANFVLLLKPMSVHAENIRNNEPMERTGCYELLYVVNAYNQIYEENRRRTMLLKHQAEIDPLTGLLNRGSYDRLLKREGTDIALILIDVDVFKEVNDSYGHEVGDQVLVRVAETIRHSFRDTDYVCRIGGDEFAVIMTEMPEEAREVVKSKIMRIRELLAEPVEGLPDATISAGVAFSCAIAEGERIYRAADKALYEAKRRGRNTHVFYDPQE